MQLTIRIPLKLNFKLEKFVFSISEFYYSLLKGTSFHVYPGQNFAKRQFFFISLDLNKELIEELKDKSH